MGITDHANSDESMDETNQEDANKPPDVNPPEELKAPEEIETGEKEIADTVPVINETNKENTSPDTAMEVHHHPQLEHKPKAWKEYILEGLMIFVAVMMGFIAENIREGITNRAHARELISQLSHDLRNDTAQLNDVYQAELNILNANDSLIVHLQYPVDNRNSVMLQQWIIRSHDFWPFHPSTGAIAAIKNELHLKQFSSSKIIGLIAEYEKHIDLLRTVQAITLQYQRSYLDPFLLKHFTAANLTAAFKNSRDSNAAFRNFSAEDLTQLGVDMVLIRINTAELLTNNRRLLTDAVNLLQYIKEEYHPADE